jgi:hypothetical protein
MYNVTLRRVRVTIVAVEKQKCMLSFSTVPHKRHDFREKCMEGKMCVLIVSKLLSESFLILRQIQRDVIN